jgi:FkbM family methyltransferase
MSIYLSTPDDEQAGYYTGLTGPLLERYAGDLKTVVDLGAHVGAFTCLAVKEFGAELVFAVEPDPTNFSHLIINIEANGIAKNVIPIMAAIAPKSWETRKLHFGGSSGQLSTTYKDDYPYIEVRTLGFADLMDLINRPIDFLKMDIEGSEWELFKGRTFFEDIQWARYLDIEFHPTNDPKYHSEKRIGQVKKALQTLRLAGFNMQDAGERWNHYGYIT